ncbi:hypothetical protein [Pallidibacillus pasinlerensis]|uniref:Uncharacterized protein n=1 Tax=Pallidibacillus pasinlerensis TaxID=2703818 RepID=A0ABX0A4M5_9BACI|nr:hypothetical protein [Pallidibacillus pasinlerensis]NCU18372.1 hypothetical protein [Pallidibacillus pasinlerensis]
MGNIRDVFTFFFSLFCVIVFSFILYLTMYKDLIFTNMMAMISLILIIINLVLIIFGFKNCKQWQTQFNKKVSIIAVVLISVIWIALYFIK